MSYTIYCIPNEPNRIFLTLFSVSRLLFFNFNFQKSEHLIAESSHRLRESLAFYFWCHCFKHFKRVVDHLLFCLGNIGAIHSGIRYPITIKDPSNFKGNLFSLTTAVFSKNANAEPLYYRYYHSNK